MQHLDVHTGIGGDGGDGGDGGEAHTGLADRVREHVLCEILALHSCDRGSHCTKGRVALHEPHRPSCFIVRTQSAVVHP
jgi:hypothetical protein